MKSKTAVVTGASRGIGKAIAIKFAQKGYRVAINCLRREKELEETAAIIRSYHTECITFIGDVSNYAFCKEMFTRIEDTFGSIDVLVNNAGIAYIGLFQEMEPPVWERLLQVNLGSVLNCSNLAVASMLPNHSGAIINISSVWGNIGASCEAVYSAAKGGMNAFTKSLAKELAPSGIRVNAVACGAIDTEMNQSLGDDVLLELVNEIPMNRLGRAEEVADLVYHLAYKDNYLTGQVITMDGAWV